MSGSESIEYRNPEDKVFGIIRSYYSDLSKREFELCRIIAYTMWDFHWDVAYYEEVVARTLSSISFIGENRHENRSIIFNEHRVHREIDNLVKKGVLNNKIIEFLHGNEFNNQTSNERVLEFSQTKLYKDMQNKRLKLGCYY